MNNSVVILGRQPKLGLAELESLYGADSITPFGDSACLVDKNPSDIDFKRLGGSMRLCEVLDELPNNWNAIEDYLLESIPQLATKTSGKLSFGISVFGLRVSKKQIARTALQLKKVIKQSGTSVRMVPHNDIVLGTATVLYNKLTSANGWELCIISDGQRTVLARTTAIQDIDAYAARDQARPMRDAKVGMLPPKLAQIIINLAVNQHNVNRILDPFCGTGVLLQEATLMDYDVIGTDVEPRMIQYSIDNLNWLDEKFPEAGNYRRVEIGDATTHVWHEAEKITHIACETYLGQPLSSLPPSDQLSKIMQEVNALHHKFLKNIAMQIKSGTRLCLAIPTWRGKHEFLHLSTLDYLDDLGYNRLSFSYAANEELIYHRENQVVGRELLVLEKR